MSVRSALPQCMSLDKFHQLSPLQQSQYTTLNDDVFILKPPMTPLSALPSVAPPALPSVAPPALPSGSLQSQLHLAPSPLPSGSLQSQLHLAPPTRTSLSPTKPAEPLSALPPPPPSLSAIPPSQSKSPFLIPPPPPPLSALSPSSLSPFQSKSPFPLSSSKSISGSKSPLRPAETFVIPPQIPVTPSVKQVAISPKRRPQLIYPSEPPPRIASPHPPPSIQRPPPLSISSTKGPTPTRKTPIPGTLPQCEFCCSLQRLKAAQLRPLPQYCESSQQCVQCGISYEQHPFIGTPEQNLYAKEIFQRRVIAIETTNIYDHASQQLAFKAEQGWVSPEERAHLEAQIEEARTLFNNFVYNVIQNNVYVNPFGDTTHSETLPQSL